MPGDPVDQYIFDGFPHIFLVWTPISTDASQTATVVAHLSPYDDVPFVFRIDTENNLSFGDPEDLLASGVWTSV